MQDFIDYLKNEEIISNLKKYYKKDIDSHNNEIFLNNLIQKLKLLENFDLNYDLISSLYENVRNHKEKKKLGEFYTPTSVVEYILNGIEYNNLNQIERKKLIDISCGSGSFIIQAIRILVKRFLEIYKKNKISELTAEEAKTIISRVKNNVFGVDVNRIACILGQININYILFDLLKIIKKSDTDYYLPVFNIENVNALTKDYVEKFDYVVGNPPYLFIRDIPRDQRQIIENGNFKTNDGQYDYYQIFMELGIRILEIHGLLGYIVPDSLLVLSHRSIVRKYIYNNTIIREIYHTGPKFNDLIVSNTIIILQKEKNLLERRKNQIKLRVLNKPKKVIPQEIIEKWGYRFLIHLNRTDISIIDHLDTNFPKLKDLNKTNEFSFLLSRGVELTKTGEIIYCETCKKYSPVPKNSLKCHECNTLLNKQNIEKIIYDTLPEDMMNHNYKLYLYSINRYEKTQYKYIDTSKIGINYKDLKYYDNRIVIRQISQDNRICATYDKNLSLTSQSFYNLKIEKSPILEFNNFYLLGILNSDLLSYYFIKSFGSYKQLFPRILIEKIKDFPIKIPIYKKEKEKAEKIVELVKKILRNIDELKNLQRKIDSLVFDLYKISDSDRKYILNYLKTLN
jgi:hypothetical protein